MVVNSRHSARHRQRKDSFAKLIISGFGGLVLITMAALVWHLASSAWGLFFSPQISSKNEISLPFSAQLLAIEPFNSGEELIVQQSKCHLTKLQNNHNQEGDAIKIVAHLKRPCDHELRISNYAEQNLVVDVSASGLVRIFPVSDMGSFIESNEHNVGEINNRRRLTFQIEEEVWRDRLHWNTFIGKTWIMFSVETSTSKHAFWINKLDPLNTFHRQFNSSSKILPLLDFQYFIVLHKKHAEILDKNLAVVSTLNFPTETKWAKSLTNSRSLYVQYNNGILQRWVLFNEGGKLTLSPSYSIPLSDANILSLDAHGHSNGGIVLTDDNTILLFNRVSGELRTQYHLSNESYKVQWLANSVYVGQDQTVKVFDVSNLPGMTSIKSLTMPQHYEGRQGAEHVWQSASAVDFYEQKFSLAPLLMGSLKSSMLALIVAIPIAIGAAVYSAYFASNSVRQWLKPSIEMLEAVPSVLIGFIAAVWLAPIAEKFLLSLFFVFLFLVITLLIVLFTPPQLLKRLSGSIPNGYELYFCIGGIGLLCMVCYIWSDSWLESLNQIEFFRHFLISMDVPLGKTTTVVAIALGIAISPSIFSIVDDAIYGVPSSIKQASYALGATRVQTLQQVVFKVAMPGIIAAFMIGFGRAFGETMILLMVTGNTPIANWDFAEGLRTLTANLAIELPEAEVGSSHYHVLFLTACILFLFTFIANTVAELLRSRLRKRKHYD